MLFLTTEDYITLNHSILFQGLDTFETVSLLNGEVTAFPAGQILFRQGDVIDRVIILLSGTIHASCLESGGREFLYQQLLPSYLAGGEVACTHQKTSPYDMYAESSVRIWSFSWSMLEDGSALPVGPRLKLLQNLLSFVANQNIQKYCKIDILSSKNARDRILKYLKIQSVRARSPSFSISLSREAMAHHLCLNRSVLSHELKQMEADGLIRFRKNQFTLLGSACPLRVQQLLST